MYHYDYVIIETKICFPVFWRELFNQIKLAWTEFYVTPERKLFILHFSRSYEGRFEQFSYAIFPGWHVHLFSKLEMVTGCSANSIEMLRNLIVVQIA